MPGNFQEESTQKNACYNRHLWYPKTFKTCFPNSRYHNTAMRHYCEKGNIYFFENKALNIPDVFNVIWAKKLRNFSHVLGTDCLLWNVFCGC